MGVSRQGGLYNDTGRLLEPKDEEAERPQKETGAGDGQDPLLAIPSRWPSTAPKHMHLHWREQPRWNQVTPISTPDFWERELTWTSLDPFPACLPWCLLLRSEAGPKHKSGLRGGPV